jgi:hypothetical protein
MPTKLISRIASAVITLLALAGTAGADHCKPTDAPALLSKVSATRVAAIKLCLAQVATQLSDDATFRQRYGHGFTKVYTYGHPNKINAMLHDSKQVFWDFTVGFQARREERYAISMLPTLRPNDWALAAQLERDHYDLEDLLTEYKKVTGRGQNEQAVYKIASFAKIYPRFRAHAEHGFDADRTARSQAQKNGEAAADNASPGFDSTGGFGVYLALEAHDSAEHIAVGGSGVVCDIPATQKLINLDADAVKAALVQARVYVRDLANAQGDAFILRPTGKNLFVSPGDFEQAAAGYLVAFRPAKLGKPERNAPYVVDKLAINYATQCHELRAADFVDCDRLAELIGTGFFADKNPNGDVLALLKKDANFRRDLFAQWRTCAGTHRALACDTLINEKLLGAQVIEKPLMKQLLYSDGKAEYKQVLTDCHCNPTEANNKLSYNCPTTLQRAQRR